MRSKAVVVLAALSAALITGGWLVGRSVQGQGKGPNVSTGMHLFDQVVEHVARYYVDSIPARQLADNAATGLVRELGDPNSALLTPERLRRLNEATSGTYAGIGVRVDVRDGWVTVVSPVSGSPGERAGLRAGDRIVEIDGDATRGLTAEEATKRLRGAPDTPVKLVVERAGVGDKIPVTLKREAVHVRSVARTALLADGVGYLNLTTFSDSSAREVRRTVDSLRAVGARTLVLDLRGNPGGLLDQGVAVADLFLGPGQLIARTAGRTADVDHRYVDGAPTPYAGVPLVVLVDEGSASAAEIVAGALQDHDRALVVGAPTYGKGSAQRVFPLQGGRALKLTTALWYTPAGRSINRPLAHAEDDAGDDVAAPADSATARARFRTDAGRTVYGGGGITPDVAAGDTALSPAELGFIRALGRQVTAFRDAISDYARQPAARAAATSPTFAVTPAMRDAVWAGLAARGVTMPRSTFDAAATLVDRQLGYEIVRVVLGPSAEFGRRAVDDSALRTAVQLLAGARTQEALLAHAAPLAKRPVRRGER